jgi:hypothetical protein
MYQNFPFTGPTKYIQIDISRIWQPGLPDGLFSTQKSRFGYILESLRLENVDIFYGHFGIF